MTANWPITAADLRKALELAPTEGDEDELTLFAQAACELIDERTGRSVQPDRWELTGAKLPLIFRMSARETAALWWRQSKNGPRNRPPQGEDVGGPPAGADLPRKVQGWLASYPPRLFIADTPVTTP